MDQNRLEELKRLLDERCGGAKQNRSEELDAKNSEIENFKTENFEVSNFEVLNSEVSNSEISNYETQNSKVPNSEASNSETSNSETLNSDPDALNLEAEADRNSVCENNAEPQNFTSNDSGSLRQNSKVRDYGKYPLVIKDHTYYDYMKYSIVPTMVGLLIALAFATIVNPINIEMFRLVPLVLVIFVTNFMNRDGTYFVFYNDKILYYNKNKIRKTFELNKIGAMVLSFDWRWSWKQKIPIFIKIFLVIWFLLVGLRRESRSTAWR